MRRMIALSVALFVALAFSPLVSTRDAGAAGVLRLAQLSSDLQTLDPHFAASTPDRSVVDMVFNGLIRYKPGDGSAFEPDLATALPTPRMTDGKQVWTFQLRKGVMCHASEGVPAYELTSEDVVYSFQKAADKNRSAYAADYTGIAVDAPDGQTVRMTLERPLSTGLFYPKVANYSGGLVVCKKAAEKLGPDGLKTHPVGTGPFVFKSYTPQERVVLVANLAYFRGKPQLDGVEVRYMPDLNSRELGLRNGQLDVINGTPDRAWVDGLKSAPNVKVDVFGVGEVATLFFRTTTPPLDKPAVRKALAYALDRKEFLALIGPGIAEPVFSPVPAKFLPGGLTEKEVQARKIEYAYDPAQAKRLLAEAGFPQGFSLEVVTSELPGYRVLYESMQGQLAKVGVKVAVKVVDHATMHSMIRKDANPLVIYIAWRPNADVYLTQFFHSDSIVVSGKKPNVNFAHYDRIDALIERARGETDQAKQIQDWKDAQVKILEDMVAYPIQYQNQVYARSAAVDYGHDLISVLALYPGITEKTRLTK
jgi:peptide/nickel transport system substrate-binding protein